MKVYKNLIMPLMLLAILFVVPFTLAEENELQEFEDLEIFTFDHGAEIRFLQLERSLEKNIVAGEKVIEKTNNENLTSIIDELETLLEGVKNVDLEQDAEVLAESYLDIKTQARDLTKEFRDFAHDSLNEEQIDEMRNNIKEAHKEIDDNFGQQVSALRLNYKIQRELSLLDVYGIDDEELKAAIEKGTSNRGDIARAIRGMMQNMTQEERRGMAGELKESRIRNRIAVKEKFGNLQEKFGKGRPQIPYGEGSEGIRGMRNADERPNDRPLNNGASRMPPRPSLGDDMREPIKDGNGPHSGANGRGGMNRK